MVLASSSSLLSVCFYDVGELARGNDATTVFPLFSTPSVKYGTGSITSYAPIVFATAWLIPGSSHSKNGRLLIKIVNHRFN